MRTTSTMNSDYVFSLSRLTKTYGQKTVLDDISLAFLRGARIGVIGHNGSGKSTLLRVLAGVETDYDGTCIRADKLTIGYLSQEPELTPGTVKDNLEEAVQEVKDILKRYDELNEKLAEDLDPEAMQAALDELEQVQTLIDHTDAWELGHRLEQAAHALGLPPAETDVSTMSGGERRRVALCKMLLRHPDVLLLDEPTNHLDADAVFWLENHLDAYDGTVISITHDRYFLDNVAQWMLEMHHGKGIPYKGNYSEYLAQRAKRESVDDAQSRARKKRLEHELEWINTNPKGRLAKNKARIRNYEQLYQEHQKEQKTATDGFSLMIPITQKLGQKVLKVEGISKSYGAREVLKDVTFEVPPGAVVGVIGPNGTGKTTLLKLIAGQLEPDSGTVELGPTVDLCHVDQDRADMNPDNNVWKEITDGADELTLGKKKVNSRAYVSKFNFRGADQQQLVGTLSGGQRNRVQLAKMLRQGGNLLLVDEPTNDLDVSTIRVLEEALEGYAGSAIVVSHDRFFLDRVATHILAYEGDCTARFWDGNYATYHERRTQELEAAGIAGDRKGTHRRLK